jgi:hypothetical protein
MPMGIRRRINGTISFINQTTGEIRQESLDLLANFKDGFGVKMKPTTNFSKDLVKMIKVVVWYLIAMFWYTLALKLDGIRDSLGAWGFLFKLFPLPDKEPELVLPAMTTEWEVVVDPTVDAIPPGKILLEGGDWDGYLMSVGNDPKTEYVVWSKDKKRKLRYVMAPGEVDVYEYFSTIGPT